MTGASLLSLARAWFDEGTVSRVFEPLVADWQRECAGLSGTRRAICRARGSAAFATTFILAFARDLRRPLPAGLGGAAWLCIEAFAGLGTIVLAYTWRLSYPDLNGTFHWMFLSMLTMAMPLALVPASIVLINRSRWQPHDVRRALVRTTAISVVAMIALAGWVTPSANQRWRESVATSTVVEGQRPASLLPRGVRELTQPELFADRPPADLMGDDRNRSFEFHHRMATFLMPVCALAVGIAASKTASVLAFRSTAWWVLCALVWSVSAALARNGFGSTADGESLMAWIPSVTLLTIATLAQWLAPPCRWRPRAS
jgi:hypothetical protein